MKKTVWITRCALAFGFSLAMAAGMSSCGTDRQVEGRTWVLQTYRDADGATTSVRADVRVDARFSAGLVSGSSGCNFYCAPARISDGALEIGVLAVGGKTCLPSVMEIERAYLTDLARAATVSVEDASGLLIIGDANGNAVLTFGAEKPRQLPGSSWKLTAYSSRAGELVPTLAGTSISVTFDEDGAFAGLAGCNSYWGSYAAEGGRLSLDSLDATRLSCSRPEGIMEQERAYLRALRATATFTIAGDTLELRTAEGSLVATFDVWKPPSGG